MSLCPCGLGKIYSECCGLFISNKQQPATPEELMRSRYTAYSELDLEYIARTMKGPALAHFEIQEALEWARKVTWLRLEVLASQAKGVNGLVEFKAHYSYQGRNYCLHELSEFRLENKQWFYFDGKTPLMIPSQPSSAVKIPRNDPCPCGSNKKHKKCCGSNPH